MGTRRRIGCKSCIEKDVCIVRCIDDDIACLNILSGGLVDVVVPQRFAGLVPGSCLKVVICYPYASQLESLTTFGEPVGTLRDILADLGHYKCVRALLEELLCRDQFLESPWSTMLLYEESQEDVDMGGDGDVDKDPNVNAMEESESEVSTDAPATDEDRVSSD